MSEKVLITRSKIDNLANAIKDRTSSTSNLTLDEMKQKIEKELYYIEPIQVVENVVINPPSNGQITYTTFEAENVWSRNTYYIIVEGTTTWQTTTEYFYYAGQFDTPANNNYPIPIPLEPILKSGSGTLHTLYLSLGVSKVGIAYLPDANAQYCTSTLSIKYYTYKYVELNNFYITNNIAEIDAYVPIDTTTLYAPLSTETQTYTGHGTAGYTEVTVPMALTGEFNDYITGTLTSYNNSTISFIGYYGLARRENLQSVSIPNCTLLSSAAFYNCINLQTVYIPNLSTLSGASTFQQCYKLSSFSASISVIPNYTFKSCYILSSIYFPNVTSIGYGAFQYCSSLTSINFSLCTTISAYAFQYCQNLSTVNLPICSFINQYAFNNTGIINVSLPSCQSISTDAFAYCASLLQINLPLVSIIGDRAFNNDTKLHTVSIGSTCNIYGAAFYNCYNLLSLYLTGSSVCTLSNINAFTSTPISTYTTSTGGVYGSIYVPASLLASYKTATNWITYSARFVGI